ncbi:MAG TPA: hypothetical protein VM146_04485 [Steroidobacteraceae bacterium]|nr:hypothetical protein [Steroidobacteraceae bacterium]
MRRLTLILSDLYLPADVVRESFPTTLELPALQALLRFAESRRIADWRTWLSRELGAGAVADWPIAHVSALAAKLPVEGTWMATPVALEARLDHVRLRNRGLLRVPSDQQEALQREFTRLFGQELGLEVGGGTSLMLRGGPEADITTVDPARLLDSDIALALPGGAKVAGELRRLGAEIEMWLHSSPLNASREKARQPRISSLWVWGGGVKRPELPGPIFGGARFQLHGTDAYVSALQQLMDTATPTPTPLSFPAWVRQESTFIEFAPMSGAAGESLLDLEQKWFAPARDALSKGELDLLRVVANDKVFEVRRRSAWKFWRRRRSWLESLA